MTDTAAEKADLRTAASARRAEAHAAAPEDAGARLAGHAMAALGGLMPGTASVYLPYESEIDSRPLLTALAGAGWRTALPVVVGKAQPLVFRVWREGDALVRGVFGIPVPAEDAEVVRPDVVFVPMLAFDPQGYRLGYGGGFYDRTLEMLRTGGPVRAIGIAYAGQQVARCPTDDYDQPLDLVVTETGAIPVGPGESGAA